MIKFLKKTRIYSNIALLRNLFRKTDVNPAYFIIATGFSFAAAFCEGVSVAFLIPLVKGIISMDFSVNNLPHIFKIIISKFPKILIASNQNIFVLLVGIIFVSAVLKNILLYAETVVVSYQNKKFSSGLRKLIFRKYLSFGKLYFDRNNIGYMQSVLLNFSTTISNRLSESRRIISTTLMIFVYLIIMFRISWALTLIVITLFPILNYSVRGLIEQIKAASKIYAKKYNQISHKIFNILSCISLVKLYSAEEKEKEHFKGLSEQIADTEYSIAKYHGLISPIQEIVVLFAILLLIAAMAFMTIRERIISTGNFLVFFYLLKKTQISYMSLVNLKAKIATVKGPLYAILTVLDSKDKFFVMEGKREFTGLQKGIELRGLSFSYVKNIPVLDNVSFFVEKGKMTAIVGPTGAGKTTLINLVLHFYNIPPSSIFIDGTDMREFTLRSVRSHMALVNQDVWLLNDTIKNNIVYGLDREISEEDLIDVAKKARLYDFIKGLPDNFSTYVGDRGVKLSGGEKQRVAIARALLKKTEILILDEATSALDTRTEKLIQEAIAEAVKDRTTIVIAHRLSTIKNADKIVVVERGRFVEEGSLAGLLEKKGKFYEYWQEQKFY